MTNLFRRILPLLLASGTAASVVADNITSKAWMLKDERQVNGAQAYDIYHPVNSLPFWKNIAPMSGSVAVSVWFPVASEVSVSGVQCHSQYERFNATMQLWEGGRWNDVGKAKKIFFRPKPPVKTHLLRFILSDITNKDHDCLGLLNWRIDGSAPGKALYAHADMSLSCDAKDNTFDLGTPAKLKVSVADKTALVRKFKLTASLISYQGSVIVPEKVIKTFSLGKDAVEDTSITFKHDVQGPYLVTAFLYDDVTGILLAAKRIMIGFRDPAMFAEGTIAEFTSGYDGKVMSIDERIAEKGTIFSADATQSVTGRGRQPGDAYFNKIASVGGEMLMSILRYSDFEPLPGVYNFEYFDYMVKKAGKYGLGLEAGLWWWDFSGPTQYWLKDERIRQRDGSTGKGWEGVFSVHSRKFSSHAKRAVELFIKRYRNCPEIWLWQPHPYGAVDHDGHGIYDFHPDTLKDWAVYLEKKYGSIDKLNKAYSSQYKNWQDVPVPAPLYEGFEKKEDFLSMVKVVDTRPQWIDWLDFYHRGLLDFRVDMMKIVRANDKKHGISGINATGGVGKADLTYAKLKEYDAFYGDQGLNLLHYVRRLVAKRRYGLRLRHEDIAPITIGRRGLTEATATDRCNWDVFQICLLGASHFNYVFTAWTNSPFWDLVFANPRTRKLVKESNRAKLVMRPVGYMHSFTTDRFTSKYNYQNIPIARWWMMNGFSDAMLLPGNFFEIFSDGCELKDLKEMKVVIDDGTTVMTKKAEDALVNYVKDGGKLILFVTSGQRTMGTEGEYNLLHSLGYKDTASLLQRQHESAMLVLDAKNPVFGRTATLPLNKIAALKVPKDGIILGRVKTDIGAVMWPCGKGQVVLIGGIPGSVTEDQIQVLWSGKSKEEKKKAGPLWSNAERELGAVTAALTRDAAEWAGVQPQFSLPDRFRSCLKRDGDKTLVYMYNNGPAESAVLRVPGLKGRLNASVETLTDKKELGEIDADKLASPGISLPELGRYRFMVVRIQPAK